jgi:hypothetical protein
MMRKGKRQKERERIRNDEKGKERAREMMRDGE